MADSLAFFFGLSFFLTILISPLLIVALKSWGITRRTERDFSALISSRAEKAGTPVMGGVVIIFVVTLLTVLFNWDRATTYVPIGVLLLAAFLGGADDLLNIFYQKDRHIPTFGRIMRLISVHKYMGMRMWYAVTLPWHAYKRFFYMLGSHPGGGIQAHEKILVQFVIGVIVAWWISFKLDWTEVWLPWIGSVDTDLFIVPLIIFLVMFMANAVNITDGIDGLSAGTLVFAYGAYFFIALQQGSNEIALLIATIIGALLGYLFFNIKPAKYQMGDVASLGMGIMLTAIAFALDRVILLPLIGGIFIIEIFSVLLQAFWRVAFGRRLFLMAPLHHHLELIGWSEARIVMYAWATGAIFAIIGVWVSIH